MVKSIRKMLSICLVLVMLLNMLPLNAFATDTSKQTSEENKIQEVTAKDVQIVEEIIEKRTEYTKQFRLSNGLNIATVYASPVHYEEDGQWEEIDNTLQMANTRSGNTYVNTAGVWQVSFPQSMTENNGVTISKDGYVFNFRMAGELLDPSIKDIIVESEIIEVPAATEEQTAGEEETVPTTEETAPTEDPTEVPEETVIPEGNEATEATEIPTENATEPTAAEDEAVETSETEVAEAATEATEIPTENATAPTAAEDETVETSGTEVTEAATEAEQEVTEEETTATDMPEVDASVVEEPAMSTEPQEEEALEIVAPEVEVQETEPVAEETAVVSAPEENVVAEIESIDMEEIKAQAEYPETVVEKISSRLTYDGIYEDTDIIFDLNSNQVKESIVLNTYRESLRGYIYALEMGDLTPVLLESGEIELRDADGEEVIMYMPAPYLIDAAGATCFDVTVSLEGENGKYVLAYELPQEWLADSNREWPVVLDPAVLENNKQNIRDITVYSKTYFPHTSGILGLGYKTDYGLARSYIKYLNLPNLTAADVIVNASLILYKPYKYDVVNTIEVHKITDDWAHDTITWTTQPSIDETVEDYVICQDSGFYTWDITDIARSWYADENYGLMLKYPEAEESVTTTTWKQFYSAEGASFRYLPNVLITFRNNSGLESYWDYTTSSAGRAGTGYVNQYSGNLVWIRDDIGFGGNLMPVTISHVYNTNDSAENLFGMGYGWRTNFNQRVYLWDEDRAYGDYYVWEDSDGTDHYFLKESYQTYKDEDGLELILKTNGSGTEKYSITDKYGNVSYFDTYGRLTKQTNNQATKSNITITYTTTSGLLISTITDGAGRVYNFTYTNNLLSKIAYKGKGTSEITYVNFAYSNSNLTSVTDKDNKVSGYAYTTNNLLETAQDIDGYKIKYAYTTTVAGEPNRIKTISEFSGSTAGGELNVEYAHNQTELTDHNGNVQIIQFNNMGNTISIQDDQGRAQYAQYAINDPTNPDDATTATAARTTGTAKGNQMLLASKLQNTVSNLLQDSSFEYATNWQVNSGSVSCSVSSEAAYLGNHSLKLVRPSAGDQAGVYRYGIAASAGETYTLSAYVKTGSARAYLVFWDGSRQVTSDILPANSDWTRLEVSYTATSAATTYPCLLTPDAGTVYMDSVQVEKTPTASRYNLIENGDFRDTTAWSSVSGRTTMPNGMEKAPAPQLDANVYQMTGNPQATNRISQTVKVSGSSGDTFVLGGWALADSVPIRDSREFAMIATFRKGDAAVNTATVRFNYCADSTINWQYAASPIVAKGAYDSIVVELVYDYNANIAYFDGIQLYKEEFGNSYTYDEDGNIISVKDVQSQTTSYEYTNNNLTKQTLPSGAALTYTYDDWHNVKTATSDTGVVYNFAYDTYGNNTSVSIVSGSVSLTSSAAYTSDGNRLASTTDAAGKVTTYSYHENTNVLEWVQYPEDTTATRTEYTYDNMYRLAKAEADISTGTTLKAEYGYTNDLLTSITTGSTTYSFTYGAFALRSNIKIGSRTLATYGYTSRTNFLSSLDYGNGDSVDYTYNKQGRVTEEVYEDGDTVTYAYDNNGALASVTDSATGITTKYFHDFTDRLMKYTENSDYYSHSVEYQYDVNNNLTQTREYIYDLPRETSYSYDLDNRLTGINFGASQVYYAYDELGRLAGRSVCQGSNVILQEIYSYYTQPDGQTTSQVSQLHTISGGQSTTYTYSYDANGNITSVSDGTNTTSYVYDSANQLFREDNQAAGTSTFWVYDNAGNITGRTEYAYTAGNPETLITAAGYSYGDSEWGDLLTWYNGQTIISDEIGNMVYDGEWSYSWNHGRQLAGMSKGDTTWNIIYDADGMRFGRSDGTNSYFYTYDGSGQLSRMTYNNHALYFSYSAGKPTAVNYNGTDYYYVTNLQGDVVAILDTGGNRVVEYVYDAWGKILSVTGTHADTLGQHNPLRYRGYVYDNETGFYYVSSRYYDPEIGRFINADTTDILTATPMGLTDKNLFAYCDNNPVVRVDHGGQFWDTVFDVISLGASIVEVCVNPTDPWAWAGLAGDAIDLIPFVTGVGEVTRAVKTIDKVADTVQIAKAVDFTDDAADIVKTLDRSSGFTKSTASAGRKIHDGYKVGDGFNLDWKEYKDIKGIRPDYVDFDNKIIYELKPMNPRSARSGIRQLQRYNKALGGGFTMRLELY